MPDHPLSSAASSGYSYTFTNGKPAALVCCNLLWYGCGQIWALVTDRIRSHGLLFTKACREILEIGGHRKGIRKYYCIINPDIPENIRWVKLLGFEHEYTMKEADPEGRDVLGYSKVISGIGDYKPSPLRKTINELF